jgi:hypothetical protein
MDANEVEKSPDPVRVTFRISIRLEESFGM